MSVGYVVRVEADARGRRQLDDLFHRLVDADTVQLGFVAHPDGGPA